MPTSVNTRAFLIDGFVAGFWKIATEKGAATLVLEPFDPLTKKDERALVKEGTALLAFAEPDAAKADVTFGNVY